MDPARIVLYAQIVVQVVLLALVVHIFLRDRSSKLDPGPLEDLRATIEDARQLSNDFAEQVDSKARLIVQLSEDLELRIRDAEEAVERLRAAREGGPRKKRFNKAEVVKLHQEGNDAATIARMTGIPLGEVQLMIKVNSAEGGGTEWS